MGEINQCLNTIVMTYRIIRHDEIKDNITSQSLQSYDNAYELIDLKSSMGICADPMPTTKTVLTMKLLR